ncbi:monovalent cation/H+ antiporter complex subunit F [Agriterribacter sp.]|mgnify:FL=1|uniref:monovalent cation/H+ antiporter complex subunit F n=1 Tax=Agriterribacter sp. TaxID=2821509 RepID=UPI002C5E4193|nr:monovalent cation/H+ antiporter complex subunit F [Agriterribacter sp.]HRP55021.1 monovalent cation/H+ antiporter complex subunit F [Agriterribacter sp.]
MSLETYFLYVIMPILGVAALLVVYRFFKGPNIVDRVVALDLSITIGVAAIAAYCIVTQQFSFLDDAMILALIAFLSTVAFSYYLTKKVKK